MGRDLRTGRNPENVNKDVRNSSISKSQSPKPYKNTIDAIGYANKQSTSVLDSSEPECDHCGNMSISMNVVLLIGFEPCLKNKTCL